MASRKIVRELEGLETTLLVQTFSDRYFVLVTQLGKVGNLIQASIPNTIPLDPTPHHDADNPNVNPLPEPPAAIQLTPLLGGSPSEHIQTLHSLYTSQIATIIWLEVPEWESRKNVVVGLALDRHNGKEEEEVVRLERAIFRGVMQMLQDLVKRN